MFGQVHGPARVLLCLAACLVVTGTATAQGWWDAAWYERKKLPFKNADQAENLVDFPVLVVLDSTRIDYTKTLDAGEDLRFVDDDGSTVLSHEIEEWNESGTSYVWVKVPQVDGVSSSDHIWMYYDNTLASDAQDAAGVWSADYEGVWHLNTDPSLSQPGTITFDNVTTNTSSSARSSASFSHAVGTGDSPILVVVSTTRGDQGTSGVTYGGQALTLAVSADAGGSGREWVSIWYLVDPPTGSNTVVVTFNNSQDPTGIAAMSYFGVDQSAPIDVTASKTTGSSATVSLDITPTVANTMIVGGLGHHGGDTDPHTPGGGVTAERYDIVSGTNTGDDSSYAGGEIAATTVQTYTFEFTGARSDDFAIACVALKPAVAIVDSHEELGSWWDDDWTERSTLTIDNSGQTENLTNFPVLVTLDSGNIDYAKTQNAGQDLRFVDSDDSTELDFEIEEWNESGTSYVWVEVPQIDGSSSTDFIYMYYGNTGASDGQDAAGTWNANYVGVWHLNEDPSGGAPQIDDSSGSNDGTMNGSMTTSDQVAGQIGGSLDFDGSNDWFNLGDDSSLHMTESTSVTFSAWINTRDSSVSQNILRYDDLDNSDGDATMPRNLYLFRILDSSKLQMTYGDDGPSLSSISSTATLSNDTWYHVVAVRDVGADTESFYIDGSLDKSETDTSTGTWETTGQYAMLGKYATFPFDGQIDEVRFSDSARSADWIKAQYLSMTDALITYADAPRTTTSYDGTPGGAMTAGDLVTGQISGALDFDDTDDRIEMGDVIDMGTSDMTFSAWIKPTADGHIQAKAWANPYYGLRYTPGGDLRAMFHYGTGEVSLYSTALLNDGDFHYITAVWDRDGDMEIYVDGVSDGTLDISSHSAVDISNTNSWVIGSNCNAGCASSSNQFGGIIDEVRIDRTARSADWIKAQYLSMTDAFIDWGSSSLKIILWQEVDPNQ
jgi:hypothetical protein